MIIQQERFEAWLFGQPDERAYNYLSTSNCLICMFVNETTAALNVSAGNTYVRIGESVITFEGWLQKIMCDFAITEKQKFGVSVAVGTNFGQVKDLYIALFGNPLANTEMVELPAPNLNPQTTNEINH